MNEHTPERLRAALFSIPADCDRDTWVKAGMAFHAGGGDFDTFDEWSAQSPSYNTQDCRDTFRSFKTLPGGIGPGTLFGMARNHGWKGGTAGPLPAPVKHARQQEKPRKPALGMNAGEVWERCLPATAEHTYIRAKQGNPDGLRVVPAGDPLRIIDESMVGALVVPVLQPDGTVSTLQLIPQTEVVARLKADGKPGKLNLPGGRVEGWFTVGKLVTGGTAYVVEGIGQAWACWQATGAAAVVCFGACNMRKVATALRQRDNTARLVLVPDAGIEDDAYKIAAEIGAAVAAMPDGEANNFDANDLMQRDGFDKLAALLESATEPPVDYPVSVAFADELPDSFVAPDELVEGVLTAGAGSVLYGDSNSGKTFLAIDMAASVARGVPWMGKRTEQGMVVYLAAESPASVRSRLQAYQKHHSCKVPNFTIVQSPINLFDGEDDTDKVIKLVQQLERQRGQKVRLIVGDTLARLSAGANENAGQDMGLVVKRFDRICAECKAHFLLIHHCGKNAAAGQRGWSGVRGAIDSELEVTDSPSGRCVEITKQRDLGTKGQRIGFRLDTVVMGLTKWGEPATSCVVAAADAPVKKSGKRVGEIEGAVIEFLAERKTGMKKSELAKYFVGRYDRSNVYRAISTLVTAHAVHEAAGMVCIAEAAK